jgi:signal recognition particle GTPase
MGKIDEMLEELEKKLIEADLDEDVYTEIRDELLKIKKTRP